eukprot:m.461270 g.461270  ORF g.461270 m.461270 type:complete len:2124 (+) comp22261_c0_seq1:115-6486(+)
MAVMRRSSVLQAVVSLLLFATLPGVRGTGMPRRRKLCLNGVVLQSAVIAILVYAPTVTNAWRRRRRRAPPPVHGRWSGWSYSRWSTSCGRGTRSATRYCNNPGPAYGGSYCGGSSSLVETRENFNAVQGGWAQWQAWSASCGDARTRIRVCTNPAPSCGGTTCEGDSRQTVTDCCPVHGFYAPFSVWSAWAHTGSITCNVPATRRRSRVCTNPVPRCNGNPCFGQSIETESRAPSRNCCAEQYYVVGENYCRPCTAPCPAGITEVAPCRGASGIFAPSNRVCRDTTPPVITLLGPISLTVEGGEAWRDPGYIGADSAAPFNITAAVHVQVPNMLQLGTQVVRYTVSDTAGLLAVPRLRTVYIRDTTPPVITLNGNTEVHREACCSTWGQPLCAGSCVFSDLGAYAMDSMDGLVQVAVTGTVFDLITPNMSHIITYTARDRSGNIAVAARTVTVVDGTAPLIQLLGNSTLTFEASVSGHFTDPGAVCGDIVDGDLSALISASYRPGLVNLAVPGQYHVDYQCQDRRTPPNVAATVTRTVVVQDTTPPELVLALPLNITCEAGSECTDPGFNAHDSLDGNITLEVMITPHNPFAVVLPHGTTIVYTYLVTDNAGLQSRPAYRTVTIVDTTPPTISVPGDNIVHENCYDIVSSCSALSYYNATDNNAMSFPPPFGAQSPFDVTPFVNVSSDPPLNYSAPHGTSFNVTYVVIDAAGNVARYFGQRILVLDRTPPTIIMNNVDALNRTYVEAGSLYVDSGVIASDGAPPFDLSSLVTTVGVSTINTMAPPHTEYLINYTVTDSVNLSTTAQRTVVIIDTVPPIINLLGNTTVDAEAGVPFLDAGVDAFDPVYNSNLTSNVTISAIVSHYVRDIAFLNCNGYNASSIAPAQAAQLSAFASTRVSTHYAAGSVIIVRYVVVDRVGNSASVERTVRIVNNVPPTIAVNGNVSAIYEAGTPYVERWATARDRTKNFTGCITATIHGLFSDINCRTPSCISSALNSRFAFWPPGYQVRITYSVTNGAGLSSSTQRVVTVMDRLPPSIYLVADEAYTVNISSNFSIPQCICNDTRVRTSWECLNDYSSSLVEYSGSTTVTFTCADQYGNSATTSILLRVINTTVVLNNPESVTFFVSGGGSSSRSNSTLAPTSSPVHQPLMGRNETQLFFTINSTAIISESAITAVLSHAGITIRNISCTTATFVCEAISPGFTDEELINRLPMMSQLIQNVSYQYLTENTWHDVVMSNSTTAGQNSTLCLPESRAGILMARCFAVVNGTRRARRHTSLVAAYGTKGSMLVPISAMGSVSLFDSVAVSIHLAQLLGAAGIATRSDAVSCQLYFRGYAICIYTTSHLVTNSDLDTLVSTMTARGVNGTILSTVWIQQDSILQMSGTLRFLVNTSARIDVSDGGAIGSLCLKSTNTGNALLETCAADLVCRRSLEEIFTTGSTQNVFTNNSLIAAVLRVSDLNCNTHFFSARSRRGTISTFAVEVALLANGLATATTSCVNNVCNVWTRQPYVSAHPVLRLSSDVADAIGIVGVITHSLAPTALAMGAFTLASASLEPRSFLIDNGVLPQSLLCDQRNTCVFTVLHADDADTAALSTSQHVRQTTTVIPIPADSSDPLDGQFSLNSTTASRQDAEFALLAVGVVPARVSCILGTCEFETSQGPLSTVQAQLRSLVQSSASIERPYRNASAGGSGAISEALRQEIIRVSGAQSYQLTAVRADMGEFAGLVTIDVLSSIYLTTGRWITTFAAAQEVNLVPVFSMANLSISSLRQSFEGILSFDHDQDLTLDQIVVLRAGGLSSIATRHTLSSSTRIIVELVNTAVTTGNFGPLRDPFDVDNTMSIDRVCINSCSTEGPSNNPTTVPSLSPSKHPTQRPTSTPSVAPSNTPSSVPTQLPTRSPTFGPSNVPSSTPTPNPTRTPTDAPSHAPTFVPTETPTRSPTRTPSNHQSSGPTQSPSSSSGAPSNVPTSAPTLIPTDSPSGAPSNVPLYPSTQKPSSTPSGEPNMPTSTPTQGPTRTPTSAPNNPSVYGSVRATSSSEVHSRPYIVLAAIAIIILMILGAWVVLSRIQIKNEQAQDLNQPVNSPDPVSYEFHNQAFDPASFDPASYTPIKAWAEPHVYLDVVPDDE